DSVGVGDELVQEAAARRRPYRPDVAARVDRLRARQTSGAVDAPDDHRPVGVTFEEGDEHVVGYLGQVQACPACAAPLLRDAHPAGRVALAAFVAIPGKLDLWKPRAWWPLADEQRLRGA